MEKNKELTPMQELIGQLDTILRLIDEPTSELDFKHCISVLKEKAIELLPKEKQVIEDAVNNTNSKWYSSESQAILNGSQYYNSKYKLC